MKMFCTASDFRAEEIQ